MTGYASVGYANARAQLRHSIGPKDVLYARVVVILNVYERKVLAFVCLSMDEPPFGWMVCAMRTTGSARTGQ